MSSKANTPDAKSIPVDESMVPMTYSRINKTFKIDPKVVHNGFVITMYIQWIVMAILVPIIFAKFVYNDSDDLWIFIILFTICLLITFIPAVIIHALVQALRKFSTRKAAEPKTDDSKPKKEVKEQKMEKLISKPEVISLLHIFT